MRDQLFTLEPGFMEAGTEYFCPDCAFVEGILSYYPVLREQLDVNYLDFPKPRDMLVALLGEANQGCPVLVLTKQSSLPEGIQCPTVGSHRFINDPRQIANYLASNYGVGKPH